MSRESDFLNRRLLDEGERIVHDIELTDDLKRMVMSSCDVRGILESWDVHPVLSGNQWHGYCPDHVMHDGCRQHLPKWFMNADNGDCMCFTSSKASNFVYVARRMYGLRTVEETIDRLTNGNAMTLPRPVFAVDVPCDVRGDDKKRRHDLEHGCAMVNRLLSKGHVSDECAEYFARDGITRDTIDFLGVRSIEDGSLEGRAVIPFVGLDRKVCGYVAVNYMGEDWWVRRTYDRMRRIDSEVNEEDIRRSYKKTLYCPGFLSRSHLYGLYEVLNGGDGIEELVIVEGERDAMKLLQEGVDCVSVHGTSLKSEQKSMIKRINPRRVFLGFDMDDAGDMAVRKAMDSLVGSVEEVYVLDFPDGKDPKKFSGDEIRSFMRRSVKERIVSR